MHTHTSVFVRAGLLALLALLLLSPGEPTTIDPFTGLRARTPAPTAPTPPVVVPSYEGVVIEVLWDVSHGVYPGYEPSDNYSDLVAQLAAQGFHVTTTTQSVTQIDLSPYRVIVLCLGSLWDTPYTAAETTAVRRFVRQGGGLLVMNDNEFTPDQLEFVTDAFSTEANEDEIVPFDLYFSTFANHPIFAGVQSVYYRAAGIVDGVLPAVNVARTDNGEPVVVSVNGARVILLGDINVFDNSFKPYADNALFATNVFNYLAGL